MFSIGSTVCTYSGEIGTVLSGSWTDQENGEQLVTVQVGGRSFPHGVAELETVSSLIVVMEDEPVHTDERPFCDNVECPCHSDQALIEQHIKQPLKAGLLNVIEANRIWRGEQV